MKPTLPNDAVMARAARLRMMIFDVDGILTDGSLHYSADGEIIKTFNVMDGLGIKLLGKSGVATAIITARKSPIIDRRAADLDIAYVTQGAHDKRIALEQLLAQTGIGLQECGFIGDDIIDLPIFSRVGLAVSVPAGHPEVRARAHYITEARGGWGAVRELCDIVLRAQGKYDAMLAPYLL